MGLRGELFSTRVLLQNRSYFFNVKENRAGDLYLNIVESKNRDEGGFDRQSVVLFADDIKEFLKGFEDALRVLEKETRERRQQGRAAPRESRIEDKRTEYPEKPRKYRTAKAPRQPAQTYKNQRGGGSPGKPAARDQRRERPDFKTARGQGNGHPPQRGKRVIIKKK
ncbi:MAG: DUF3276 family protein [Treponema sp.]|jgi:hypothetical protein|nr:DUF3276 family protein [Treponema sp.]